MTPLHAEHAAVVAISNRLFEVDEVAWRVMLARAHRLDITLLALIYHRLREVRDDVARQAFSEQRTIADVARERLATDRAGNVRHGLNGSMRSQTAAITEEKEGAFESAFNGGAK